MLNYMLVYCKNLDPDHFHSNNGSMITKHVGPFLTYKQARVWHETNFPDLDVELDVIYTPTSEDL